MSWFNFKDFWKPSKKKQHSIKVTPNSLQSQAIDITDAVWDTYNQAYDSIWNSKQYHKYSHRKLRKLYPLSQSHHLKLSKIYNWINSLDDNWSFLGSTRPNIFSIARTLEANHSDNFYELTTQEKLYHYIYKFLKQTQDNPFPSPQCYFDKKLNRIILPGDEQHFLLPKDNIFNTYKYHNNQEWWKLVHFINHEHNQK